MIMKSLQQQFLSRFGAEGMVYAAPGRINLIGEHTDYNGGFVFPGAIAQCMTAVVRPNGTRMIRAYALDLDSYAEFSLDDMKGPEHNHHRYVFGVAREMMDRGVAVSGFDTVYSGNVPLGAGMSSSAALESCFAFAINDLFGDNKITKMELAKVGQATEHKYVGVNCGIMDQFASVHGRKNCLMRLDCRSGEFEYFPWNPEGYRLLLVNSCVKHSLVGSPYNDRRRSCEHVAAEIGKTKSGVETLRDCDWNDLERVRKQVGQEDYRRARFVLGEVDRVLAVCDALNRGDYETVGKQMYLTHEGLSQDYEVSCEEIDFLVDVARRCSVTGSRIMGGGFGGCTINLVRDSQYSNFVATVKREYQSRFGIECKIIDVEICDGARRLA
ncbi:MAG: galactokinase [Bacteroidales bacterium]|nr:galactokinase [Candidatus Colimorpha onthohippi]